MDKGFEQHFKGDCVVTSAVCPRYDAKFFAEVFEVKCFGVREEVFCEVDRVDVSDFLVKYRSHYGIILIDIFKEEPISIKGVLNYGLKDVSKGLHKLGFIKTIWQNDMDGRIALLEASEAMNKSKKDNLKFSEMEIVKNIEKYNYVDVKVIDEIIEFLRTKI